jgi:GH25 family lysozyme M1 (1,4-beta-N-acetylmuramidase)
VARPSRPLRNRIAGLSTVAGAALTVGLLVLGLTGPAPAAAQEGGAGTQAPPGLPGLDVGGHQDNIDWQAIRNNGARFAVIKATEGTAYRSPNFARHYGGAFDVGLVRGASHLALPDRGSGASQANFFAGNGGGWRADDQTLPGTLDIGYNPYGAACYGLSRGAMVAWIADFMNTYHARTGRRAIIYTSIGWWKTCTGNHAGFGADHPLWIARHSDSVGELPAGWSTYTFWQWADPQPLPGNEDVFNGTEEQLLALANNT